jgi:CBS domain-containing protein
MTDTMSNHEVTRIDRLHLRVPVVIAPEATLAMAARVMRVNGVSAVVVGHASEPIALVTERDLTAAMADARPLDDPIATVASVAPLTVSLDDTVIDAVNLMLCEHVRHLIVTRDHRLIGVVSMRDLLAALVTPDPPAFISVHVGRIVVDPPELWLG